jgi:hypothetical protein
VHRQFGQQLEDGRADVAAFSASSPAAAARSAWAEAEAATGIEYELESAAWADAEAANGTEAGIAFEARTRVVLAQMVTKMLAEVAAGLPALLMKCAPIAGPESEAESAGGWGEWVSHVVDSLRLGGNALALPIRQRYIGIYRDATINPGHARQSR